MREDTLVFVGPASPDLGRDIALKINAPVVHANVRLFPDGESCVSGCVSGAHKRLVIVQGTHPPQDRHLQQLYQMVEAARSQGDQEIICVVPYLAYSRQDRRSRPGEPLSAEIVLRTLQLLGADEVVTVDVHNPRIFDGVTMRWTSLSMVQSVARHIASLSLAAPLIVAPDAGGERRTRLVAEQLRYPTLVLSKSKTDDGKTSYGRLGSEVSGRDAVVIDDLASSGSTLIPLVEALRAARTKSISLVVTHLFADTAALQAAVGPEVRISSTDTVPSAASQISLAPVVASYLSVDCVGRRDERAA